MFFFKAEVTAEGIPAIFETSFLFPFPVIFIVCKFKMKVADKLWAYCVDRGIKCKQLLLSASSRATHSLIIDEKVKYGTPLISVPYEAVVNAQNIRGGLVPRSVPPLKIFVKAMTRHRRMDTLTAHTYWLTACVAAAHRSAVSCDAQEFHPQSMEAWIVSHPVFSRSSHFDLEKKHRAHKAFADHPSAESLEEMQHSSSMNLEITSKIVAHFAQRQHLPTRLVPQHRELVAVYYALLERSILLPLNCELSSPGDLGDLLDSVPSLPLIPSLVPLVDLLRQAAVSPTAAKSSQDGTTESPQESNCTIHTCQESDFVSPSSRRRVLLPSTSSVFSSRRVVICAKRDIHKGEVLTLQF